MRLKRQANPRLAKSASVNGVCIKSDTGFSGCKGIGRCCDCEGCCRAFGSGICDAARSDTVCPSCEMSCNSLDGAEAKLGSEKEAISAGMGINCLVEELSELTAGFERVWDA